MDLALRIAAGLAGLLLVVMFLKSILSATLLRAARTDRLFDLGHALVARLFRAVARPRDGSPRREQALLWYLPAAQLTLMFLWFAVVTVGFGGLYYAAGSSADFASALVASGSALSTLGFATPSDRIGQWLSIVEGAMGLFTMVYLLTFIPGFTGFAQDRDDQVAKFCARAGTPPSGAALLCWHVRHGDATALDADWPDWESWFLRIAENHVLVPPLMLARPFRRGQSWVVAAGGVLDALALRLAVVDLPPCAAARAAYDGGVAAIDGLHRVAHARFPAPLGADVPVCGGWMVTRERFDAALADLAAAGVPLCADRDAAYATFAARRVEYAAEIAWLVEHVAYVPEPCLLLAPSQAGAATLPPA